MDKKGFLGKGWGFPPEFNRVKGEVKISTAEDDIRESLHILLSTRLGERVMQPDYGCNLEALMYESLTLSVRTQVSELIKTAILYHEPRIDVEKIDIYWGDEQRGEILIQVNYRIRSTNSRSNMVFPFYKEEGTNV
ncbi:GPW/gp25 family protein [Cytophagaceae bacterium ABcell3]|nr:GPW/gp25 family protein [Cytophagaceae bacterium ABcell3]